MTLKQGSELTTILFLSLVLAIATLTLEAKAIRIILGFPFMLLFPGYLTTAAIFPGKNALGGLERLVLSFGLSITIVPILCYSLNFTPWGITLYPVVTVILIYIACMTVLAWQRRKYLPEDSRLKLTWKKDERWGNWTTAARQLNGVLLGAILFAVAASVYALSTPVEGEKFTEFYVLSQANTASRYPQVVNQGSNVAVTIGIVNHEHQKTDYGLEIAVDGNLVDTLSPITLNHGDTWEKEITFEAGGSGKKVKGKFSLFKLENPNPAPYRTLHIWLDVRN